jgi:hypothetical protein
MTANFCKKYKIYTPMYLYISRSFAKIYTKIYGFLLFVKKLCHCDGFIARTLYCTQLQIQQLSLLQYILLSPKKHHTCEPRRYYFLSTWSYPGQKKIIPDPDPTSPKCSGSGGPDTTTQIYSIAQSTVI